MKELDVNIRGSLMWISPLDPVIDSVLKKLAVTNRRINKVEKYETSSGTRQRSVSSVESVQLYEINYDEGIFVVMGGLFHRFRARVTPLGYTLKVKRWKDHVFRPDFSKLTAEDKSSLKQRNDQADVLSIICGYPDSFIVDCPTGWGKSYLICQLAGVLKEERIAIVAPGIEIMNTLKQRLYDRGITPGVMGGGQHTISRVTLCTRSSVSALAQIEWDLLLYDECHTAGGPVISDDLVRVFSEAKRIGFSASPTGRSDGADLVVEAIFGHVAYHVSYGDSVDRGNVVPIKVKIVRMSEHSGPDIIGRNSVVINRNGLWRNRTRNNVIAALAKSIPEDEQVLIMVDTAEHALRLRELLPDFEVVFKSIKSPKVRTELSKGQLSPVKGLKNWTVYPERLKKLKKDFETGQLKRAIATRVWSAGVDFVNLTHLIRADGLGSKIESIQRPGRLSRKAPGKSCGYLYDFLDLFNKTLAGRSFDRIRKYKKQAWEISFVEDFEVIEEARNCGVI